MLTAVSEILHRKQNINCFCLAVFFYPTIMKILRAWFHFHCFAFNIVLWTIVVFIRFNTNPLSASLSIVWNIISPFTIWSHILDLFLTAFPPEQRWEQWQPTRQATVGPGVGISASSLHASASCGQSKRGMSHNVQWKTRSRIPVTNHRRCFIWDCAIR